MVVAVVEVDHVVLQTWAAGSRAMVELPGLAPSAGASSGCAPRAVVSPDSQQDREGTNLLIGPGVAPVHLGIWPPS